MESSQPTADNILKHYEDSHEMHFHELDREWIIEAMHEFAKHHRAKAIEAIDKKINEFYQEGNGMWPINEDLENAYPETEIK